MDKLEFLRDKFVPALSQIEKTTPPLFGKMNVQQMIEHMTDSIAIASERLPEENHQAPELTAKMKAFMMSDKPFKDNTPNPLLPDTPPVPRHSEIKDSLNELQQEINSFIAHFANNTSKRVTNPFFGDLNFEEWVHLLHKHAMHHLRQFGVSI